MDVSATDPHAPATVSPVTRRTVPSHAGGPAPRRRGPAANAEPTLPDARMHLARPNDPALARVVETRLCTRGGRKSAGIVRHVAFDVGGTPLEGSFLVGQSFGVLAPGTDHRGRPHAVRLYSIASPSRGEDGRGRVVATTVKRTIVEREPQKPGDDPDDHSLFLGVASNYLCDLREGDEVRLTGPQGRRFLLPTAPHEHDYLFIATGTGIAPFRGMALELLEGPDGPVSSEIHLVMGVPYRTELLYDDLFRELEARHPNFHYHTAVSREAGGCYVHDLLVRDLATFRPLLERSRTLVYVCGLIGVQFGLYRALAEHELAEGYLLLDEGLASASPSAWTAEDLKRRVRSTGRLMVEVY